MPLLRLTALGLLAALHSLASAAEIPMYVGTYIKPGPAEGIYLCRFNTETGALSAPELAVKTEAPGFLVQHPSKKIIYAVAQSEAAVSAFAIEEGGKLRELNRQPSMGKGPTHLAIDRDGLNVLVADYLGSSLACLPIAPDGTLRPASFAEHRTGKGVDPKRQEAPHPHSVYVERANRHVYTCDLGLDRVYVYRFDAAAGALTPEEPPFASVAPGAGPRHLAFSGDDAFVYCANELNSTLTAFARDQATGALREIQTLSTLPPDAKPDNTTSELWVHPNHRFLYISNRGSDTIAGYTIAADGQLTLISQTPTQGDHPRYFRFDPTGQFLIVGNMLSNNIAVFRLDLATGRLAAAGAPVACPQPSSFLFPR